MNQAVQGIKAKSPAGALAFNPTQRHALCEVCVLFMVWINWSSLGLAPKSAAADSVAKLMSRTSAKMKVLAMLAVFIRLDLGVQMESSCYSDAE